MINLFANNINKSLDSKRQFYLFHSSLNKIYTNREFEGSLSNFDIFFLIGGGEVKFFMCDRAVYKILLDTHAIKNAYLAT